MIGRAVHQIDHLVPAPVEAHGDPALFVRAGVGIVIAQGLRAVAQQAPAALLGDVVVAE